MSRSRPGGGAIVTAAGIAGAAGFVIGSRHLLSRQAAKARAVIGKPLGEQALQAAPVYKQPFGSEVDLLMPGDPIPAGLGPAHPRPPPRDPPPTPSPAPKPAGHA